MGVLECGAMAMRGFFDVFDRATGAIEHIEELLARQEIQVEFHPRRVSPDGEKEVKAHLVDRKGEWEDDLKRAKEMIAEACQIAQNVMAEMP